MVIGVDMALDLISLTPSTNTTRSTNTTFSNKRASKQMCELLRELYVYSIYIGRILARQYINSIMSDIYFYNFR